MDDEYSHYSVFPIRWVGRIAIVEEDSECGNCGSRYCLIASRLTERCVECRFTSYDISFIKMKLCQEDTRQRMIV